MCWWHMATHWQLGVQVQEQTWVLKSQLAEAEFSACALGASMPGKCSAKITPPCSTAFRPLVDAACQGTTAAIQIKSEEQMKRKKKRLKPPRPILSFKPKNYIYIQNSIAIDFLWLLSQRLWAFTLNCPCRTTLPVTMTGHPSGHWDQELCVTCSKVHSIKPLHKTKYDLKVTFT